MIEKTCSICSQKITLSKHLSGLVFEDEHFLCEECCTSQSDEDIMNWTRTIMQSPQNGMPIALWLVHEQNKDKVIMSSKK